MSPFVDREVDQQAGDLLCKHARCTGQLLGTPTSQYRLDGFEHDEQVETE